MREPLRTDRLILRDITEADAELLFDLDADPEVMRYIGPRPAPDVASYRERTRTVYVPFQAHPWHGVRIVLDHEGYVLARWLAAQGFTAYVLFYRLPGDGWAAGPDVALSDAQRAMRLIRARAIRDALDPERVAAIGFSAGGHLASTAGTHFDDGNPKADDAVERQSSRPDFVVLVYPVISMGEKGHGGSRTNLLGEQPDEKLVKLFSNELQVTDKTPPATPGRSSS